MILQRRSLRLISMKYNPKILLVYMAMAIITLLLMSSMTTTHVVDHDPCEIENKTFDSTEHLVYKIYYNLKFVWIPAGEVSFDIHETDQDYEVTVVGKTYTSYNSFFEVNDYFYSRFDKETLLPEAFVRIVQEGKYRKFDSLYFDQSQQLAYSFNGRKRATAKKDTFALDHCMHDMVSILYHMRNIDFDQLNKKDELPVQVMFDEEIFPLSVKYLGTKKKKIKGLGKRNTIVLEPQVVAGEVFDENTTMKIYASNDDRRIPLMIESPVSVGSVKAILKQ